TISRLHVSLGPVYGLADELLGFPFAPTAMASVRMGPLDLPARRSGLGVDLPPRSGVSETMTRPHDGRCILIAGPRASGKSWLALSFAERLGGVVINADSMQVYRELRILTALPTREVDLPAPRALYGFVNGS